MKKIFPILLCASVLLAGCSTLFTEVNDRERLEQVTGIDKHSSYPAIRRGSFERVNLLELVDPENHAAVTFKENWGRTEFKGDDPYGTKINEMGAKYDLVLADFRQRKDITDEEKRRRRNSIQERMLSVSISRCNVFKTYLRRDQADKNFLLGTATTVSGVLGAVLPGASAARYLAGTAGLFSGIRSEYNQAYFGNLAAYVIAKGIETRQELVYRRIQTEGQSKSIQDYPLEAAIKDAIYFDGLCSVVEGLDQASESVDATTEPGLDAAMRTVLKARLLKEAADMPSEMLLKPETLDSMKLAGAQLGMSLVGSTLGDPVRTGVETDLFISAKKMMDLIKATAYDAALRIETAALDRKKKLLDEMKDRDKAKELEDKGPLEGETSKAIREKITNTLLEPLKLDNCYPKLAADAVKMRIEAAQKAAAAGNAAERASSDLELANAERAIAEAYDKLRAKEKLVIEEISDYRNARIDAIQKITGPVDEAKLQDMKDKAEADPPDPSFSKNPSCEQ